MTGGYYRHLGLTLWSDRGLPRLTPVAARPIDLCILTSEGAAAQSGDLPWAMSDQLGLVWRAETEAGSWLRLLFTDKEDWAEFVVDPPGTTVWMSFGEGVQWEDASELLLGRMFSGILIQRGRTCLHAGVVRVGKAAVGFIGETGAGKSTTSLALVQRGAVLVSDDVAVLSELNGRPAVSVGVSRLRIRSDISALVSGSFEALAPQWSDERPGPAKRYLDVAAAPGVPPLPDAPIVLHALYFLATRQGFEYAPTVQPVSAAEALPRLMVNRHMAHLIPREGHARDFGVLARVAVAVRVGELRRPEGLHALDQTVDAVLADVGAAA